MRVKPTQVKAEPTTSPVKDALFYTGVTLLGVGVTSLCLYGYRKIQEYLENTENAREDDIDITLDFQDCVTNEVFEENSIQYLDIPENVEIEILDENSQSTIFDN